MSGYRFVAPALLLVLGGCAAGPDYERPELDVPENYIQPVQQGESFANTPWWERPGGSCSRTNSCRN
jgi:multidrug efflux system outer membrane protein